MHKYLSPAWQCQNEQNHNHLTGLLGFIEKPANEINTAPMLTVKPGLTCHGNYLRWYLESESKWQIGRKFLVCSELYWRTRHAAATASCSLYMAGNRWVSGLFFYLWHHLTVIAVMWMFPRNYQKAMTGDKLCSEIGCGVRNYYQ